MFNKFTNDFKTADLYLDFLFVIYSELFLSLQFCYVASTLFYYYYYYYSCLNHHIFNYKTSPCALLKCCDIKKHKHATIEDFQPFIGKIIAILGTSTSRILTLEIIFRTFRTCFLSLKILLL